MDLHNRGTLLLIVIVSMILHGGTMDNVNDPS